MTYVVAWVGGLVELRGPAEPSDDPLWVHDNERPLSIISSTVSIKILRIAASSKRLLSMITKQSNESNDEGDIISLMA